MLTHAFGFARSPRSHFASGRGKLKLRPSLEQNRFVREDIIFSGLIPIGCVQFEE
jgi:hypothetical protein